jgi:hypothetical protein
VNALFDLLSLIFLLSFGLALLAAIASRWRR